jgi:DNA-binding winged helix-turn-helix (wHTH) protein
MAIRQLIKRARDTATSYLVGNVIRFDEFELDVKQQELRRNGQKVELPRQSMRLLILLAQNRHRVVMRNEIRTNLWEPDITVGFDAGINTCIFRIREALGDAKSPSRFIEVVPKAGYRFIGRCRSAAVWRAGFAATAVAQLAALAAGRYGDSILLFIAAAVFLALRFAHLKDGLRLRIATALFAIAAMAFIPSAWSLPQPMRFVINMDAIKPAVIYPFVVGLRFIPLHVLVLAYWAIFRLRGDAGFAASPGLRNAYWLLGSVFLVMTWIGIAVGYGDYQIWEAGLPQGSVILACYGIVFAANIYLFYVAFLHYNVTTISNYNRVLSACALSYFVLAAPAIVVDQQYNDVNKLYLDQRRSDTYQVSNPDAIYWYRQRIADGLARDVGPDLASIVNDPEFERVLRTQPFFRQDFDEPFQQRGVIYGFKDITRSSGRSFVLIRFPNELADALRFQLVTHIRDSERASTTEPARSTTARSADHAR